MKMLRTMIITALVLGASTASADQARFKGMLRKYAVDLDTVTTLAEAARKARTPCLCLDAAKFLRYGYLWAQLDPAERTYQAGCHLPVFASDGTLYTVQTCSNFRVLGK
jgi:hypothetical protein